MEHDPMCRYPRGWWKCECEEYLRVRVDERERAADRIFALSSDWRNKAKINLWKAMAAARGDGL